jgi:hypothetical protein
MNNNPPPKCHIYPKKSSQDAPYSLSEEMLREAIYIPAGFSYGATGKQRKLLYLLFSSVLRLSDIPELQLLYQLGTSD